MTEPPEHERPPSDEERRRAACAAMAVAPSLIRFAARYAASIDDAEDAYQRAMEIALTRAPVTEGRRFTAWLHAVIKNEALASRRARGREAPGAGADVATTDLVGAPPARSPEALQEWRERYRALQEALAGLTESQRVCLMLQSAGASYVRIEELTGFTRRKVERSILEGRRRLQAFEVRLAEGEQCRRLDDAVCRVAAGESSRSERRAVRRHVRHCIGCRAALAARRAERVEMAALVPIGLAASGGLATSPPDPSPLLAYLERLAHGASTRAAALAQVAIDAPAALGAKAGAGAVALAITGAAGGPLVADAVVERPRPGPAAPEATLSRSESPRAAAAGLHTAVRQSGRVGAAARVASAGFARVGRRVDPWIEAARAPLPPARPAAPAPAPAATARPAAPEPRAAAAPAPPAAPPGSPGQEFGP